MQPSLTIDAEGCGKEETEDAQVRQVQESRGDQRFEGPQEELPVEGLRLRQLPACGPEAAGHGRSGKLFYGVFVY